MKVGKESKEVKIYHINARSRYKIVNNYNKVNNNYNKVNFYNNNFYNCSMKMINFKKLIINILLKDSLNLILLILIIILWVMIII